MKKRGKTNKIDEFIIKIKNGRKKRYYKDFCPTCKKERWVLLQNIGKIHVSCRFPSFEIRFWNLIEKTNSCWIWKGAIDKDGYGLYTYKYKRRRAHRLVWFLTYGKFPLQLLCHKCDNPPCVNPSHLFEGTALDNFHDAIEKKRFLPNRKLTMKQAMEIRNKYIPRIYSRYKLAKEYKVGATTIFGIIKNITYKK